jgi:glycosyltransferase involved in cell wall biosynthesis
MPTVWADRMHVLIVNQYALPTGAAGITRHGDIGAELVRRGYEVTVVASDFDYLTRRARNAPQRRSRHDGVQFIWLRTGAYTGNDSRRVRSMARFAAGAAWVGMRIRPRPDVIIGSSPQLLAGLSASVAARLLRRPWVFEVRDFWPSSLVDLGALGEGGMAHRALVRLERSLYRGADAVVTVPPNGCVRLEELRVDASRCVHIPNAATAVADRAAPAAPQGGLRDGDFIIVYTGAHGVANQLGNVIDAAAILRMNHPEHYERVRIDLIGDGQERARLSAEVEERGLNHVRIHGSKPKADIPVLLAGADACLVHLAPADVFRYGLSPNKLFDYFAAGKPVLISSAYPTIVDEADAGIRFEPGDPEALAGAIGRMMDLPLEERAQMGERGRELVRTRYSISATTDAYESLLHEVVERRRH